MTTFFAVFGVLVFIGLVIAIALYLADLPAQNERIRLERETERIARQIHDRARETFGQMLDAVRDEKRGKS